MTGPVVCQYVLVSCNVDHVDRRLEETRPNNVIDQLCSFTKLFSIRL